MASLGKSDLDSLLVHRGCLPHVDIAMKDELLDMKSRQMIPSSLAKAGIIDPCVECVYVTYRDIHGFDNEWQFRMPDAIAAGLVSNTVLEPKITYRLDGEE